MSKSAPKAPDAGAVAAAQGAANKEAIQESAKVNAINMFAPWGSTTYDKDEDGLPTAQRIELGGNEQEFYDTSGQIRNALAGRAGGMVDYLPTEKFQLSDVPSGDAVGQTLYDRRLGMVAPQLKERRDAANLQLMERGIPINSEIYNAEMGRLDRGEDATYTALAQDAQLATAGEEDRLLSRALTERSLPFNEVSAFLQGAPAVPTPSFASTPAYQIQPPDIQGQTNAAYGQQMQAYNARQGQISQGLFGLLPFLGL